MIINSALASVSISNLDEAKTFYGRLFGRPADVEPMPSLAQWNIEPVGGVQVVVDTDRCGSSMVTFLVADFDATVAELNANGFSPGKVIDGVMSRVTQLHDPAGNIITFAEIPAE